ncbi:MAG TPA: CsbD family protein [Acidimicrobiales bacterium]
MAGEFDEAKGRATEAAGALTDDDDLKAEGKVDKASGKTKDVVDNVKDKVDDAIDNVRDRANRD